MKPDPAWWSPADWPAPEGIRAGTTLRGAVRSAAPFDGFNLALHVGDDPDRVRENRTALIAGLQLAAPPCWLDQQHGNVTVKAGEAGTMPRADACFTDAPGKVCTVLTADCVPLLLCDSRGMEVAAVHVGWRGLCRDVIGSAVTHFQDGPRTLMAWCGPHIRACHYTVRDDMRDACLESLPGAAVGFRRAGPDAWQADMEVLVRDRLQTLGISRIYSDGRCTFHRKDLFYSYRRDGRTGRTASLIWIRAA